MESGESIDIGRGERKVGRVLILGGGRGGKGSEGQKCA